MKRVCLVLSGWFCLLALAGYGEVVNLYFAGGQSNAKAE